MKNILLYSRRGYSDGFLLILFIYEISESDNILLYRRTLKKSRCTITIQNNYLSFDHLSEITAQRIAKKFLNHDKTKKIIICASWNKKENFLGAIIDDNLVMNAIAEDQPYKVRFDIYGIPTIIHKDAIVFREISDEGEIASQKAIDSWNTILEEVNILLEGIRDNTNYVFCLEIYKNCITKLVTGLEVFLKNRFIELEELIPVNYNELTKFVKKEKKLDMKKKIISHRNSRSVLKNIIPNNREFNFQNWGKSKELYKRIYDISFEDIPNLDVEKLRMIGNNLVLRHRISHTDKVTGIINDYEAWYKKPVRLDIEYVNQLKSDFIFFVTKLHEFSETKIKDEYIFDI